MIQESVPKDPINNKLAMVGIMVWRPSACNAVPAGTKPLPEPMLTNRHVIYILWEISQELLKIFLIWVWII